MEERHDFTFNDGGGKKAVDLNKARSFITGNVIRIDKIIYIARDKAGTDEQEDLIKLLQKISNEKGIPIECHVPTSEAPVDTNQPFTGIKLIPEKDWHIRH